MAWTQVGGDRQSTGGSTPVSKWQTTGQTVEGVYRGQRLGKFGPLFEVETDRGPEVYPVKTALETKLKGINPGDLVKVEYLGKRKSAQGREYMDFAVWQDVAPAQPARVNSQLFDDLVAKIAKAKGQGIADALKAAAGMAGDPYRSLCEAATQVGVMPF